MKTKQLPFGTMIENKKNAVFLAIYVEEISPWKYFKDQKHVKCPAVIMINRWDGKIGFPGGGVEEGEPLVEALIREIKEEIGIRVKSEKVHPIVSYEGKIVTHLFGLNVIEMEFLHIYHHILNNFSRSILLHAYQEGDDSHFMSEITGIKIVPIVNQQGKGVNQFIKNSFAGFGREDLLYLIRDILQVKIDE